jgi:holo-[acyl-carrier protein] synthase
LIFGIGTDIIEVGRIEKMLATNDALRQKLFTEGEQNYCDQGKKTRFQSYAARFAAKEAFFKALGTGYRYGMSFNEIEVLNDDLGKPFIKTSGKVQEFLNEHEVSCTHLSLSHLKEMAVAFVVIEK